MRSLLFVTLFAGVCLLQVGAFKKWALLISGSNLYENYRHQSDICHAYQTLHTAGIPDEQIVVMMYDDIANNAINPFKGNIINRPGGPNVYPGVPKDYTGPEVTAEIFYAVLQGQKDRVRQLTRRAGKVIDSGPEDHIFVYFADHGGPGFLCMPDLPYVKARELNNILQNMHNKRRFAKLTFYVEACESGSMFEGLLPNNINVYATTAARPNENSFGCYWDGNRFAFLGDVYSVKWMEDTDQSDLRIETLQTQFDRVKARTTGSHVQRYGDLAIDDLVLAEFFGGNAHRMNGTIRSLSSKEQVPSESIPIQTLKRRIQASPAKSAHKLSLQRELYTLQKRMGDTHDLIFDIAKGTYDELSEKSVYDVVLKPRESIQNWECYETALDTLLALCPGLDISHNDFALRKMYVLVNLCNKAPVGKIVSAMGAASAVNPVCRV